MASTRAMQRKEGKGPPRDQGLRLPQLHPRIRQVWSPPQPPIISPQRSTLGPECLAGSEPKEELLSEPLTIRASRRGVELPTNTG